MVVVAEICADLPDRSSVSKEPLNFHFFYESLHEFTKVSAVFFSREFNRTRPNPPEHLESITMVVRVYLIIPSLGYLFESNSK